MRDDQETLPPTADTNPMTGGIARRALMHGVSLAGAMALLGSTGLRRAEAAEGSPFPTHKRWKLVFVNHVTTNPFFVPTQYAIADACAQALSDFHQRPVLKVTEDERVAVWRSQARHGTIEQGQHFVPDPRWRWYIR